MNTLCNGFDYRARYAAPKTHGEPIRYGAGTVTFPPLAFWRCRYGFRGTISPQWAEYLSLDFQPLGGFATGIVMRILDYLYESPCGGSAEDREAVLTELAQFVDVPAHFRLRANSELADGRLWRCHFFQRVPIKDLGFWQRLALVYASLAPHQPTHQPGESERPWCHALIEEALFWQAPICTPQWMESLSTCPPPVAAQMPAAVAAETIPQLVGQPEAMKAMEAQAQPDLLGSVSTVSAKPSQPPASPMQVTAPLTKEDVTPLAPVQNSGVSETTISTIPLNRTFSNHPQRSSLHPISLILPFSLHERSPRSARASPLLGPYIARSAKRAGRDPPKL